MAICFTGKHLCIVPNSQLRHENNTCDIHKKGKCPQKKCLDFLAKRKKKGIVVSEIERKCITHSEGTQGNPIVID